MFIYMMRGKRYCNGYFQAGYRCDMKLKPDILLKMPRFLLFKILVNKGGEKYGRNEDAAGNPWDFPRGDRKPARRNDRTA